MSDLMTTPARTERQRARRKTRRSRRFVVWLLLAALAGGGTYLATQRVTEDAARPTGAPPRLRTTLVAMRLADDTSAAADSLTIFTSWLDGSHPVRLFLPSGTLATIPGQGFEPLSRALGAGDSRLLELSVENLLGLRIDSTLVLDDVTLGRMVDAAGGLLVTAPETITETEDGVSQQVVTAGEQRMDGATALTYMTYRSETETELTRFARTQAVLDALATVDAGKLSRAASSVEVEGPTVPKDVRAFAGILASRGETANLVLPVATAGGSGAGELYSVELDRTRALLSSELPGAMFTVLKRPRVDVRNGNGAPGIGERVAALLVPDGFAIELSGNAPNFSEDLTKIVIYEDSSDARERAERIRGLLGVGRIELARRGQSVVDLTVVIGRDFKGRAS